MFIRLFFFLNFFLAAAVAHADPISAIGLVVSGVQALASGATILSVILRTALGLGLSLLQKTLSKQKNKPSAMGSVLEIKMGEDQPMTFPVGSRAVGGRRKYIGSWGSEKGTPNAYLTDVIEISSLPSFAGPLGITSVWIGQKKCGVLWDRPHPDGRGYPIAEFFKPNGTPYMWIKYYDGTQTAADPFLVSKFGSHPDRPYGADRIGRGCQYVILTTRLDNDLGLGGTPPEVLVEPHPTRLYDPRKDSTNGGFGNHRYGDWSTYEPALNPMVVAYNVVRGIYYTPDEWVFGGQNVAAIRLPNSAWFAAMNECDRDNGSGVAQYRCGLEIQCDQEPLDVIEDLRVACAGRIAEVGGMIKPLVGAPGAAVYSFDDLGIIVTEEQDFQPFPSLTATHNRISGTYPEPTQRWTVTDAPEQRNLAQEAEDGQRSLAASVRFDAVPYSAQVQHLMKTMATEQRRFRIHTLTLPPAAWPLEPNDVLSWSSDRNSYNNKKFILTAITGTAGMLQRATFIEIDPTDYDPPTIYIPAPNGWIGPITAPSQPMTGWTVEPATIKDAGGIDRRPAIKISCGQDLEDVAAVWVQVRLKATGDVVFDSDANPYASPYSWIISGNWMISNTDYEARGRYLPRSNRATDWSAWLAVKTPNVLIQAADVLDGAIIQSKIADAAVTAAKIMDQAVSSLKLADQAVSTAKLQVAAVTADVLASGAVISTKLADGAVTAAKLAQGAVDATSLASSIKAVEVADTVPTTGNVEGRQVFLTTDGKLYRYHNGAWTAAVAASDVSGTLVSSQLADASVTAAKLAAAAVDATKFASGIRPVEIVASLPTTDNLEGRTVYLTTDDKLYRYTGSVWTAATAAGDISGQITNTQISDGAISTPKLGAGVVTADKIAANSITAGQIAAGAIGAAQIAASAITADKLAAGSVSTSKLAVGSGTNLLQNSSFTMGTDCWTYLPWGTIPGLTLALTPMGWSWSGKINPTLRLWQSSGPAGSNTYADVRWLRPDGGSLAGSLKYAVPCAPGEWFEATAYVSAHRCQVDLYIAWIGADGSEIGYSASGSNTNNAIAGDSNNPDLWLRLRSSGAAPANAVAASILIRKHDTQAGGADSYAFINKPMLCRIPAGATEATPWSDGGVVLVTGGGIVANAITAEKIAAKAITVDKLLVANFDNIIDAGFSAGSRINWAGSAIASYYLEIGTSPVAGTYVAQCDGRDQLWVTNLVRVSPGESYHLSVWVYNATSGIGAGAFVGIWTKDSAGNNVAPVWVSVVGEVATKNQWMLLQGTVTIPAGVYQVQPEFSVNKAGNTGEFTYWARPNMRRASGSELIVDGAITAGKIAANAVTAGTIAAGAVSAAQIAAGAITTDKLGAGSVSTQALAVGTGGNYLTNSDLNAGLTGWAYEWSPDASNFRLSLRTDTYAPLPGAIEIYQANDNQGGQWGMEYGVGQVDAYGNFRYFPVKPGGWYELSVYYFGHRCKGVQPYLGVLDANDNLLAYPSWGVYPAYQNFDPQKNLANYNRFWGKVQMPANAAKVRVFFRMKGTVAGQGDSYLWLTRMYFGEANPNQTEPTPWSDGSLTLISGGNIVSNAVTADKIAANAVTAGKIAVGSVTASAIAAGAVTAYSIAGGTITGDKLAANTIGANQIAAGAITAKQLVLTDFSNMADNGWQTGTLDGWVIQNRQNFYNDTSSGDQAGWVLQSLGRDCAISSWIAVSAGEVYAFDAWVYNTDAGNANIYAATLTPSGVWQAQGIPGAWTSVKNAWVRLQGRFTVPSGYTKLGMLLQVEKTAGTGGSCYWSKPVMRRAVSAELIVDGAITANKISVNSLDAITANLGAVNISRAIIGDLQVGRSNIQAGAISRVDYSGLGQAGVGTSNTPITGLTAYHGAGAAAVLVHSSFSLAGDGPIVNGNELAVRVVISIWDSANNAYTAVIEQNFMGRTHFSHEYNFTPPAGSTSTQFRFDVRVVSGSNVTANNRTIRILSLYGR